MEIMTKIKQIRKGKNGIENITVRELQAEQICLKDRTDKIRKDITKIEDEKKKKFEEGIGADKFVKKMLATDIKGLETEAKLKFKSFIIAQKQYQFTTNFLTIKKFEKDLKKTPLWDKIASASPEKIEEILINVQLDNMEYDDLLNLLNGIFERDVANFDGFEDETTEDLMDMWNQVEEGSLNVESANKEISVEKGLTE